MSEIGRIHLRAFSPERFDLTYIPIQEEYLIEHDFSMEGSLQEPALAEKALCPLQKSNQIPVKNRSCPIENLCCLVPGDFGTAHYVNPKQFQRILKIRQKRLLCGWTHFDRKKSKARRQHAMRRERLANGRFALKPCCE
eukprot:TRINITY_DN5324_c0_g2_i2.p1 TRINITY_DN5324_c0_g2~~TRINITY_DN5324_c0_g2_i2.p1  ORF type:complete len:139 (+),score=8.35 TRINITY_DN5324_c0_g2_i2:197-613(+)